MQVKQCAIQQQVIAAQREQRQAERQLAHAIGRDDSLAPMRELLGAVTSAVLLATQGEPRGYPSAARDCKSIGLNRKEHSSGKHQGQLSITKRGPSLARCYLHFAALRLRQRDPVIKRWYALKTARPGAMKQKPVIAAAAPRVPARRSRSSACSCSTPNASSIDCPLV